MPNPKEIHCESYIRQLATDAVDRELAEIAADDLNNPPVLEHPALIDPVHAHVDLPAVELDLPPHNLFIPVEAAGRPDSDEGNGNVDDDDNDEGDIDDDDDDERNAHRAAVDSDSSQSGNGEEQDEYDVVDADADLMESLQVWCSKYDIKHTASDALLSILKPYHPHLPKDTRTLKRTPKRTELKVLANGQYSHIGLRKGMLSKARKGIKQGCEELLLEFGIDGIPFYKSVTDDSWPILWRCEQFVDKTPSVMGIFYGKGKPEPLEDYLEDFIEEMLQLREEGIKLLGKHYNVALRFILADALGRAYLKCIKGPTSKDGCERCDQEGDYVGFQLFSPQLGNDRTDVSFRERRDPEHHHPTNNPLDQVQIGYVSQFPLEPMHLIDLGSFKRFTSFVLFRGPINTRMSAEKIDEFEELLDIMGAFVPWEFTRKPTFKRRSKWKAAEYRLLLLYLGLVIFKKVLLKEVYDLYLLLYTAVYIMHSDTLIEQYLDLATNCMEMFVRYSVQIFGVQFVVYVVHSMMHIHKDVRMYGKLSNFAAYSFEDKLGKLKKLVRKSSKPIQQMCRRIEERELVDNKIDVGTDARGLLYEHRRGPVVAGVHMHSQFSKYEAESYALGISEPNNCVCFANGNYGLVQNIFLTREGVKYVAVLLFARIENFFDYPMPSMDLGVCMVSNLQHDLTAYPMSDIISKCVCLPCDNTSYAAIPLVHLI